MKKEMVLRSLLKIARTVFKYGVIFFEAKKASSERIKARHKHDYVWSNIMKRYVPRGSTSDTQQDY